MPNALVISRHFPPLSSAGASIRLVKFLKYSAGMGWNFTVLTQHPDFPVFPEEHLSAFLEREIPEETQITRVPDPFSPKTHSSKSDLQQRTSLFWGLRVFLETLKKRKKWKSDLVYAVAPVFVNAFIGAAVSVLFRKPLVLDLKDDWVGSPRFEQKSFWKKPIEKGLEWLIINLACKVLVVTRNSYKLYTQRYPNMASKFVLIPNGCDLQEYLFLRERENGNRGSKFTILSAAWGYKRGYRDAQPFFSGLDLFLRRCPDARNNTEVIFLGDSLSQEYDAVIEALELTEIVVRAPAVHREKMAERLWNSDLLFLIQPVGNTTAISGTLYEYWAVGHAPILLIAENGASSELVTDYHLGESFRHTDIVGIASYLEEVYTAYTNKRPYVISSAGVENFDRRNQAQRIIEIFSECQEERKYDRNE
jgi:glycosyltransferase involved in cell wall biosynthesis